MYECTICHQHARNTLAGVLRHIRAVHRHFEGRVSCGLNGCPTSTTYEGLRKHMYRCHNDLLVSSTPEDSVPQHEDSDCHENDDHGCEITSVRNTVYTDESNSTEVPSASVLGAKFILKIRDGRNLTQVATNGIVEDTKVIVQSSIQDIEKKVFEKINSTGIVMTNHQLADLKAVFTDETVINPFKGIETEYQQEKFIRDHFNYVVYKLPT